MKKKFIALLLPLLCLTSCGEIKPQGTYSFLLGKQGEEESKIGITMVLSDNVAKDSEGKPKTIKVKDKAYNTKEFSLKMDLGAALDTDQTISDFIKKGLTGYYAVIDSIKTEKGNRLAFGFEIKLNTLVDNYNGDETIDIDPNLIQYAVVAYWNSNNVTLQIPVSIDDLKYQLCWYGIYLNDIEIVTLLDTTKLPGVKDHEERFGTHPAVTTDEYGKVIHTEAYDMNKTFAKEFSNTVIYNTEAAPSKMGKVVSEVGESATKYYLYKDGTTSISAETFQVNLKTGKEYTLCNMKVDYSSFASGKEYAEILEVKKVSDGKVIEPSDYVVEPFTFRDYHDIKLSLAKES